jgi:hypothetical protein
MAARMRAIVGPQKGAVSNFGTGDNNLWLFLTEEKEKSR